MICVTAATGQLGRKVIGFLVQKLGPSEIVAAVRNPFKASDLAAKGVQIREADYDQPETLEKAFRGMQKVLLISSPAVGRRVQQHRNAVEAAKIAGVEHLVYTSVLHADKSRLGVIAEEHHQTEALIKSSGLNYTILRNGWYAENYAPIIQAAASKGELLTSSGEGRISAAPRKDYAEAAAVVLTTDGHFGKIYELAGDEAFTMTDLAAEISQLIGKKILCRNVTPDEYARWLVEAGFPETVARFFASMEEALSQGDLYDDSHQLSQLLGRQTSSWREVVAEVLKSKF
ncbi:MAG: SDR family oxidoreductase [Candidatus Fervidibacter sp.]|uniref:SDR family oxidoreductase n=1 Tax=Candidatus Fervidibacter sp. TaxID=3100871 RepID=UPI004049BD64